jgi:hypothetical protein
VNTWLTSNGLTDQEIKNSSVRVIPNKPSPAVDPSPHYGGHTIIITLPCVENRFITIGKIKKHIRGKSNMTNVFVDADLTPSEANELYQLRKTRNQLNEARQESDKSIYHFGIRNGRVVKISH